MTALKNLLKSITSTRVMFCVLVYATLANTIIALFLLAAAIGIHADVSSMTGLRSIGRNTIKDHIAAVESSTETLNETAQDTKESVEEIKDAVQEIRDYGVRFRGEACRRPAYITVLANREVRRTEA